MHVFNFNLTDGYSDQQRSQNHQKEYEERLAFAAEVESAHKNNMQRNRAFDNAVKSGQFDTKNQRREMTGGGGLGSGGLNIQSGRRYYANEEEYNQAEEQAK